MFPSRSSLLAVILRAAITLLLMAAMLTPHVPATDAPQNNYTFIPYASSGDDVLAMQERLKDLGYYGNRFTLNPSVFDEGTWYALASFCDYNHVSLEGNGASPAVQYMLFSDSAVPYPSPSSTPDPGPQGYDYIPYGTASDQVLAVQMRLKALSYYQSESKITPSVFDQETMQALILFCEKNHIAYHDSGITPEIQSMLFDDAAIPNSDKQSLSARFLSYMKRGVPLMGFSIPMFLVWILSALIIILILVLCIFFFVPSKDLNPSDSQLPVQTQYWRSTDALKSDSYVLTQGKVHGNTGQLLEVRIQYRDRVQVMQCDYSQVITIGRGSCSIHLSNSDRSVSSSHCDIYLRGALLMLRDHSKNGTYLNGKILHNAECRLNSGDQLMIGRHKLVIHY